MDTENSNASLLHRYVVQSGDVPTEKFSWGQITWMDSAAITGNEVLTFGVVQIDAGQSNPEHYHPNCDEILYVLAGELIHTIGLEEHQLKAGDLIHIPQGVPHQARNPGPGPCRMVVSYNTGRREFVPTTQSS